MLKTHGDMIIYALNMINLYKDLLEHAETEGDWYTYSNKIQHLKAFLSDIV